MQQVEQRKVVLRGLLDLFHQKEEEEKKRKKEDEERKKKKIEEKNIQEKEEKKKKEIELKKAKEEEENKKKQEKIDLKKKEDDDKKRKKVQEENLKKEKQKEQNKMQGSGQMYGNNEDFTDFDTQILGTVQMTNFFKLRASGRCYAVQSKQNGWVGSAKVIPIQSKNDTELLMLQRAVHPFIIPFVSTQELNQYFVAYTELADCFSLADLLNRCKLTESIIQKIAWQI
ncbi:MAG: hypothetical protein EZS28_047249, partial [Streblomastix strix]